MIIESVDRASRLDVATISDALDLLGLAGQCLGIKPLEPEMQLTGRAHTFLYAPATAGGTVGDYIDDIPEGAIVMLSNAGRQDATVWGDILTHVAHRRGVGGTVIDGACRDTALARRLGYPLFSRSYSMRTGKDRVQLEAVAVAVDIGGARVEPGDIVRGNADGVVVIPHSREIEVLDAAFLIEQAEQRILEAVEGGMRLHEARQLEKYHTLQRKR